MSYTSFHSDLNWLEAVKMGSDIVCSAGWKIFLIVLTVSKLCGRYGNRRVGFIPLIFILRCSFLESCLTQPKKLPSSTSLNYSAIKQA